VLQVWSLDPISWADVPPLTDHAPTGFSRGLRAEALLKIGSLERSRNEPSGRSFSAAASQRDGSEGDALRDSPGSVLLPQAQVSKQSFACLRTASAVRPREANETKGARYPNQGMVRPYPSQLLPPLLLLSDGPRSQSGSWSSWLLGSPGLNCKRRTILNNSCVLNLLI
jgi:hypothetical protein